MATPRGWQRKAGVVSIARGWEFSLPHAAEAPHLLPLGDRDKHPCSSSLQLQFPLFVKEAVLCWSCKRALRLVLSPALDYLPTGASLPNLVCLHKLMLFLHPRSHTQGPAGRSCLSRLLLFNPVNWRGCKCLHFFFFWPKGN